MLKVSQVAARLCVGHQTVLDWIVRGVSCQGGGVRKLTASRVGRSWRITEDDLEKFVQGSEDIEPQIGYVSKSFQRKINAEVKEYWKVMARKKK